MHCISLYIYVSSVDVGSPIGPSFTLSQSLQASEPVLDSLAASMVQKFLAHLCKKEAHLHFYAFLIFLCLSLSPTYVISPLMSTVGFFRNIIPVHSLEFQCIDRFLLE